MTPRLIADVISSGFGGVIGSGLGPWVASGEMWGFLVVRCRLSVSWRNGSCEWGCMNGARDDRDGYGAAQELGALAHEVVRWTLSRKRWMTMAMGDAIPRPTVAAEDVIPLFLFPFPSRPFPLLPRRRAR